MTAFDQKRSRRSASVCYKRGVCNDRARMPKLRGRRIAILSIAIAIIVAIGLATPVAVRRVQTYSKGQAEQLAPILATPSDQREILRVILREHRGLLLPPGSDLPVMLLNQTARICEGCPAPPSVDAISSSGLDNEVPRTLRLELVTANASTDALPRLDLPKVIESPYSSIGDALKEAGGWPELRARHSNSAGFITASRVVLSSDRQQALVYIGHFVDGMAGRGFLHVLVRDGGTWRVRKSVQIWMS